MSAARARLPAYAADLAAARRKGLTLRNPTVSVALHWRKRPNVGYGVIVADGVDPATLDWSWVRGLDVLVFRRGDAADRLMRAIGAIEGGRPKRLLIIDTVDETIISIVGPEEVCARA